MILKTRPSSGLIIPEGVLLGMHNDCWCLTRRPDAKLVTFFPPRMASECANLLGPATRDLKAHSSTFVSGHAVVVLCAALRLLSYWFRWIAAFHTLTKTTFVLFIVVCGICNCLVSYLWDNVRVPFEAALFNKVHKLITSRKSDEAIDNGIPKAKPQCWEHGCNGRQFSTYSNLIRHRREKSEQAPKFRCPNCGAEFTRVTACKGHVRRTKP
jgi:hypothetical protein